MKRPDKKEYMNRPLLCNTSNHERDYYSDLEKYCDWLEENADWLNKVIRDLIENRKYESKNPF
jgi:hypothetical protein